MTGVDLSYARTALLREAMKVRGYAPTWSAIEGDHVQMGFDFMPGRMPGWLRAFQLPANEATPDNFEAAIREWQKDVLRDLHMGIPSDVVRRMIAEHGQLAVTLAMGLGSARRG